MGKISEISLKALCFVFPPFANYRAKKKIESHLDDMPPDLEEAGNSEYASIETLKERYFDTIHTKDRMEDKTKTNVVGVTISITLITGASNLLSAISSKYGRRSVVWMSFALFILAVVYIALAGISALRMPMNENTICVLSLDGQAKDKYDLHKELCSCIYVNQKRNIIRNNYIYASYECIRNVFICLFIVLTLSTIPISFSNSTGSVSYTNRTGKSAYSFLYASAAIDYAGDYNVRNLLENSVVSTISKGSLTSGDGASIGVQNANNYLFVKFELVDKDTINILIVEPYTYP